MRPFLQLWSVMMMYGVIWFILVTATCPVYLAGVERVQPHWPWPWINPTEFGYE